MIKGNKADMCSSCWVFYSKGYVSVTYAVKINTNIAFVAAVAGIVVYIFSDKVPDKLLTHFVKKNIYKNMRHKINYQPENDSNINNDVIEKENSHTQEYEHTMLLSDYVESIKKKNRR